MRTIVLLTSGSVATLGTGAAGSFRSDPQIGCNDSVGCNLSALQNPLEVRGSEAPSKEKLGKAMAS